MVLHEGAVGETAAPGAAGCGAVVTFEGVVRPVEGGRAIAALVYEAYEPMTSRELEGLARRVAGEHGLAAMHVHHSVGRVAAGEVSFRLVVVSEHRAAGLTATGEFIAAMKRDVPLWKVAEYGE